MDVVNVMDVMDVVVVTVGAAERLGKRPDFMTVSRLQIGNKEIRLKQSPVQALAIFWPGVGSMPFFLRRLRMVALG